LLIVLSLFAVAGCATAEIEDGHGGSYGVGAY
jgi:hypothetical protein